jgi:hypothetical protein
MKENEKNGGSKLGKLKVKRIDLGYSLDYYLEHIVETLIDHGDTIFKDENTYEVEVDENGVIKGRVRATIEVHLVKMDKPIAEYVKIKHEGVEVGEDS